MRNDPVTLFGVWLSGTGWDDVSRVFQVLASRFLTARRMTWTSSPPVWSGDLAYTVAYEHTTASVRGVPRTYTLRATQIYRREAGDWKLVHRHGDELATDQEPLNTTQAT